MNAGKKERAIKTDLKVTNGVAVVAREERPLIEAREIDRRGTRGKEKGIGLSGVWKNEGS